MEGRITINSIQRWLKHYRRQNPASNDELVENASASFQKEHFYTDQMMLPVKEIMWKMVIESQD